MMKQMKKINQREPLYNEQNEGIIVCDGVSAYVCVCCRCVYVCVCVRVSSQGSTCAHTHMCACNRYYFVIFIIVLTFSTFNIDLVGPSRPTSTFFLFCIQIMENI